MKGALCAVLMGLASVAAAVADEQLILSIAPDWNSSAGRLQLFERGQGPWHAVSGDWRVLYGRNGLAWGRGEHPANPPSSSIPMKTERDRRAPAGVFRIGRIYTYDRSLPEGADYPFHTITSRDAWIDDPALPGYNTHVEVDPANPPPWFARQRMRLDDPPHRWLVEIRHNADPPVPGAGSAIFFHTQRGPDVRSSGCTVMPEARLLQIVRWLRAASTPRYVLLPETEYRRVWKAWGLPPPDVAAALLAH